MSAKWNAFYFLVVSCLWFLGKASEIQGVLDHLNFFKNNTAFNATYHAIVASIDPSSNEEEGDADDTDGPVVEKTARTLKDEEKAYVDFVNNLMKSMLPEVMANSKGKSISTGCTSSMMKVFAHLKQLKGWTLTLLDSIGKPMYGILKGNSYSLGDYDECLGLSINSKGQQTSKAEEIAFTGKYCSIKLQKPKLVIEAAHKYRKKAISPQDLGKLRDMIEGIPYLGMTSNYMIHFLGLCLPSTCNQDDVEQMIENLPFPGSASVHSCEIKENAELDYEQRVVIGILVFLGFLLLIGSVTDRFLHCCSQQTRTRYLKQKCITILVAFSVFNNTKKLLRKIHSDRPSEEPHCRSLRGLVVGTIVCLIIGNTYLPPFESFYTQASHLTNLKEFLSTRYFALTVCLPITIETLFMSYGFSLTNKLCKSTCKKKKVNVNIVKILLRYYLMLCVPLLICICFIVLLPLFGSGPFWHEVFDPISNNCKGQWWRQVGMYTNFVDKDEQCFPHLWFASCLMQIILVFTFLLLISARWPKFGTFLSICVVLGCSTAVGLATLKNKLPPSYIDYYADRKTDTFWKVNLALPLNHFGSFAAGMLLGMLAAWYQHLKIKPFVKVFGWIISLAIIIGLGGLMMYSYQDPNAMSPNNAAFYAAVHRTLFGAAAAWIVLACAYGYGGFLNHVLSWSLFAPLYKLSYLAYLFHLVIIAYHVATGREHFSYNHTEIVMRCLAYITLTYMAAFLGYLLVQAPLKSLYSAFLDSKFREISLITSIAEEVNKPVNFNLYTTERPTFNGTSSIRI